MPPRLIDRRRLLASSLGLPLLSMSAARAATIAEPVGFPDGVTFLTSGPAHGYISGWAKLLGPYLLQGLPRGTAARHDDMGGPDGVTVANAFGLRIAPDGATLMFAPGAALLAWLRGDGRVKFDPGHWIAIVAGVTPAVLVGRGPLMRGSQPVRLAATNPVGPELAALLALDLLGIRAVPAPTAPTLDYIGQALRGGSIDYALVSGPKVREALASLRNQGIAPLMTLGATGADGTAVRDPLLPSVPTLSEFLKANGIVPTATRLAAYDAAASAARTCFVATLPDLLRPSALAEWRRGAGIVDDSLSVASVSDPQDVRLLTNNAAATHLAAVLAGAPAIPLINRLVQQRSAARLG
jgi:hypothetical protein